MEEGGVVKVPPAMLAPCARTLRDMGVCEGDTRLHQVVAIYRASGDAPADHGEHRVGMDVEEQCSRCSSMSLVFDTPKATLSCEDCGNVVPWQDPCQRQWEDRLVRVHTGDYKRVNYFKTRLECVQAKERLDIDDDDNPIMPALRAEMVAQGYTPEKLTHHKVRVMLGTIRGGNTMYMHTQLLKVRLGGPQPPQMSPDQEARIIELFHDVERAFLETKDSDRQNIIGVPYLIFKLCEQEQYDDFLPEISMFVDEGKIRQHDEMFKRVCDFLGWEFYPTQLIPMYQTEFGVGCRK